LAKFEEEVVKFEEGKKNKKRRRTRGMEEDERDERVHLIGEKEYIWLFKKKKSKLTKRCRCRARGERGVRERVYLIDPQCWYFCQF
jgi:hypothetical protein